MFCIFLLNVWTVHLKIHSVSVFHRVEQWGLVFKCLTYQAMHYFYDKVDYF